MNSGRRYAQIIRWTDRSGAIHEISVRDRDTPETALAVALRLAKHFGWTPKWWQWWRWNDTWLGQSMKRLRSIATWTILIGCIVTTVAGLATVLRAEVSQFRHDLAAEVAARIEADLR